MDPISIAVGVFVGGLFFKTQQDKHEAEEKEIEKLRISNKNRSNNTGNNNNNKSNNTGNNNNNEQSN